MEKDVGCSHIDSLKTWATTSGSVQTIVLELALSFATRPFEQLYWFFSMYGSKQTSEGIATKDKTV